MAAQLNERRNGISRGLRVLFRTSVVIFSFVHVGLAFAGSFRAAAVKIDITPNTPQMLRGYTPRMSTGVNDPLFHRIVAFDDGKSSFYLISSDLCSLSPAFCDETTERLAERLGIPRENIWWTITHNHSSPYVGSEGVPGILHPQRFKFKLDEDYTAALVNKLTEGVLAAQAKLAPARLGVGTGYAEANINRRARDANGRVVLGMNPDGAVDRRIGLLRFEERDGRPLAMVANYAMHATVLGGASTMITADAPGAVAEYVEAKWGAPMLYVNGAAGNLAPLYSVGTKLEHLRLFPLMLGEKILEANELIERVTDDVSLRTSMITFETPKRPDLRWSDELRRYLKVAETGEERLVVPVRFLEINSDVLIWSAPMELFCEISNEIRGRSPYPFTFYFGYTNGTFCYLPTEAEFAAGGYEPATSPFTPSAAKHMTEAVSRHIEQLRRATVERARGGSGDRGN